MVLWSVGLYIVHTQVIIFSLLLDATHEQYIDQNIVFLANIQLY
jgi:hypothetical protein